jgi:hypothetical protein
MILICQNSYKTEEELSNFAKGVILTEAALVDL